MSITEVLLSCLQNPIITITFLFILLRLFRPMEASDKKPSNTLTGLFCVTLVIFMVVILDTLNDRPSTPPQINSRLATSKPKQITSRRSPTLNTKPRNVIKEKYGILMLVWVGFACLYLLSHRGEKIQVMGLRFMTAMRGKFNPMPNDDPIDNHLVSTLELDPTPDNKEWAIRVILAKKGISTEEKKEVELSQKNPTKEEMERTGGLPPFLNE